MTKSEFVDQVAAASGLSQEGRRATPSTPSSARSRTRSGAASDVNFTGFGKFHVAERGAARGRATRAPARR